ncbi:MAG: hypothetical protein IH988_07355, partial [Planctomycetes bacterium]|nr:hypothetical protein [Planctomycetota bacterium]
MTDQVIVCPNCSHEIKLTEAISAPIVERLRKQFEAEARKKGEELARREQMLTDKSAEIEKAREAYAEYLDIWKNADPELEPLKQQARDALVRLGPL